MPNINSNLLALRRKRLGYEQKQIAVLLGHKSTYQISRYETGQRIPSLIEAMKLSILYGLPVHTLFNRHFRRCRDELEKTINKSAAKLNPANAAKADYCSYLESMNASKINDHTADNVRHHIKVLVEERSKKILGH